MFWEGGPRTSELRVTLLEVTDQVQQLLERHGLLRAGMSRHVQPHSSPFVEPNLVRKEVSLRCGSCVVDKDVGV